MSQNGSGNGLRRWGSGDVRRTRSIDIATDGIATDVGGTLSMGDSPEEIEKDREDRARRQAITDLLFWASIGNLPRVERIVEMINLDLTSPSIADYDMRTPLHLAAAGGSVTVTGWFIIQKAPINAVDRFFRTPLEEALRAEHNEVARLLIDAGGLVTEAPVPGAPLVQVQDSQLLWLASTSLTLSGKSTSASASLTQGSKRLTFIEPKWEINHDEIRIKRRIGAGEFGTVSIAEWRVTPVAVKTLNASALESSGDDLAIKEMRNEMQSLVKVHHPNTVQVCPGSCPALLQRNPQNILELTQRMPTRRRPVSWGMHHVAAIHDRF